MLSPGYRGGDCPTEQGNTAVYAWYMLEKYSLGKQLQAVITTAAEEKLNVLAAAVNEIRLLNTLEGN
ncbi:MAG: hypothetical protein HY886_06380 [Deltaproteobacteria bacterium]|nr:hypothetical protein [Deltaproteobacteria bacterium]